MEKRALKYHRGRVGEALREEIETIVEGELGDPRIGLVSVDGKQAKVLTDGGPEPAQMRGRFGIGDTDPDFSPDDKFVATTRSTTRNYVFKGITHDAGLSSSDMIVIKIVFGVIALRTSSGSTRLSLCTGK